MQFKVAALFATLLTTLVTAASENDNAPRVLRDAKIVERLNPRMGCGGAKPPVESCCGQPWNYGPPCNCGLAAYPGTFPPSYKEIFSV